MTTAIIRLTPKDAGRFLPLRKQMLIEAPWAFSATVEDDFALDLANVQRSLAEPSNVIVAAEAPDASGALIASAGIFRMKSPKFSHRAKLWGVFVDPQHRGLGLGRAVMAAALELAKGWNDVEFVDLGVSANAPEARKLYASLGFREWGREPEATQHEGRRYDEIYMSLRIDRSI